MKTTCSKFRIESRRLVPLIAGVMSCAALQLRADVFNSLADYGDAENNTGNGWCGATSIANSFQFLDNTAGTDLMGGMTATQVRDVIVGLETVDGNGNPVSNETVWDSKITYINEYDPSVSVWAQMAPNLGSTAGYLDSGAIQNVKPTIAGIYGQLAAGEDVEIAFNGINNPAPGVMVDDSGPGGGHMVTLTGLDPTTGDFQYLDPNNIGAGLLDATMAVDGNGYLSFNWNNMNNPANNGVEIYEAWGESAAVPEPSSIVSSGLVMAGFVGFFVLRRRKK